MKEKKEKLRERFNERLKQMNIIGVPKHIIKDGKIPLEFEANGNKYLILMPDKCFNPTRQTMYSNISMCFGTNQTPLEVKQCFADIEQAANDIFLSNDRSSKTAAVTKFYTSIKNANDAFYGEHTSRWPMAYYLCSLFIAKEGEDLREWSWEQADAKIEDWDKENIAANDFLSLCLSFSKDCQEILKQRRQVLQNPAKSM